MSRKSENYKRYIASELRVQQNQQAILAEDQYDPITGANFESYYTRMMNRNNKNIRNLSHALNQRFFVEKTNDESKRFDYYIRKLMNASNLPEKASKMTYNDYKVLFGELKAGSLLPYTEDSRFKMKQKILF